MGELVGPHTFPHIALPGFDQHHIDFERARFKARALERNLVALERELVPLERKRFPLKRAFERARFKETTCTSL